MILNPEKIQAGFIPDRIQHYPIMNSKLNVLRGEEGRRAFDCRVVITNPNAISEIENNKKNIYEIYKEGFKDIKEIEMQHIWDYGNPNYWLSVATIDSKSNVKPLDIILKLEENNIESRHIWKPMHIQPYYEKYDFFSSFNDNENSVSEDIFNRGICLPSDTKMTQEEINRVIKIILKLAEKL